MSRHPRARRKAVSPSKPARAAAAAKPSAASLSVLIPLGALAAGFAGNAWAQTPAAAQETVLPQVTVKGAAEPQGKESLQAVTTRIGKGNQELRDIPQSVTVLTERLMDDRNLDDFKDVLRATAGVTFQAGETGEEDVRLRGFSLQQAGDIYVDGMRDAPLYERDTFNNDRVEVLKGSASMLFGKGSTGGIVNQVSKQPFLMTEHEVSALVGSGKERRLVGDFNLKTGDDAALRINAMVHKADNWGAEVDKKGIAPTYRWGIGTADEFSVGLYHLEYDNVPLYNHPTLNVNNRFVVPVPAKNYYGMASDYNRGSATYGTLSHTHRFAGGGELTTRLRHGRYERDLLASVVRFGQTNGAPTTLDNLSPGTPVSRTPKGRVGESDITVAQSDYSDKFDWFGLRHNVITGIDLSYEEATRNNNFTTGSAPRPTTTVGTPNDGAWVADTRGTPPLNDFTARTVGLYVQDTVELTPTLKLIGGLRHDNFKAQYNTAPTTAAPNGTSFSRSDSLWSQRFGALYQPNAWSSYYASYGTSFNTAGDTYQFTPQSPNSTLANTPPEKSRNVEVGAKFDLFDYRLSLGTALFYSEKYNERNTDPDSVALQYLLSGKRHAAGVDLNVAGRITPAWEAFLSYTWIPDAEIDRSTQALAANGGGPQVQGDRPGLTPKHSGSLWTTYRVQPKLRVGGGLNYRSEQNPEGSRLVSIAGFTTLDLMAEYEFSDKLSLKFNVANVADKVYVDSVYRGFALAGAPRTAQLSLTAKF